MTSKEAVEHIINLVSDDTYYRDRLEEEFETLQRDLETLEILKRLLHTCPYTFNNIVDETITFIYGTISGTIYNEEEFKKVQEWLENEK